MASHPLIEPGDRHKVVPRIKRLLKNHLIALGMRATANKIDSSTLYGTNAVAGMKKLQKKYHLEPDGIVGPKTWAILEKAATSKPPLSTFVIYSREDWGAKPPKSRAKCDWTAYTTTRLHHSVTTPPSSSLTGKALLEAERKAMRDLQQIGFSRGYADISYSYLVFPSGHVFEGRGFEVLGAHTLGHNSDVGICLVGNYENMKVTATQKTAVYNLRKKLAVSRGSVLPHCRTFSTTCPGKNARAIWGLSC